MKRRVIIFSLVLCTIFTFEQTSAAQKTGDVKEVTTIDVLPPESLYKQVWQPFIAQWDDDNYVVTYGLKLDGKSDIGDLVECHLLKKLRQFDIQSAGKR